MQSPPIEWTMAVGHLAALNYLRSRGDADLDTVSEITRGVVERTPYGKQLLGVALAGAAATYWWHIVKPLIRT